MMSTDEEYTEVRCPGTFEKLFMRLKLAGLPVTVNKEHNAYEFACSDCARAHRKEGDPVKRILHLYFIDGSFQGSLKEY